MAHWCRSADAFMGLAPRYLMRSALTDASKVLRRLIQRWWRAGDEGPDARSIAWDAARWCFQFTMPEWLKRSAFCLGFRLLDRTFPRRRAGAERDCARPVNRLDGFKDVGLELVGRVWP